MPTLMSSHLTVAGSSTLVLVGTRVLFWSWYGRGSCTHFTLFHTRGGYTSATCADNCSTMQVGRNPGLPPEKEYTKMRVNNNPVREQYTSDNWNHSCYMMSITDRIDRISRRAMQVARNQTRQIELPLSERTRNHIQGMDIARLNRFVRRICDARNSNPTTFTLQVHRALGAMYPRLWNIIQVFECVSCNHRGVTGFQTAVECESCYRENRTMCSECEGYFDDDDIMGSGICYLCDDAFTASNDRNTVSAYHSITRNVCCPDAYDLGCELEVHATDSCESVVHVAHTNGLIAERDGSLCGRYGIELVQGTPMPLGDTVRLWQDTVTQLQGLAESWTRSGYGFHVSICTAGFSRCHLARICAFYDWNEDLVQTIGGRSWCDEYACKPGIDLDYVQRGDTRLMTDSRYCAVAIRGSARLEIRSPRSNLGKHRIGANIQLLHAVAKFTEYRDNTVMALTDLGAFWAFVHAHSGEYDSLIRRFSPGYTVESETGSCDDVTAHHSDSVRQVWDTLCMPTPLTLDAEVTPCV